MKKYQKNEEYTLRITDIGTNGEGIGHLNDGYTLFVKGALPGDTVRAGINRAQKSYAYARISEMIEPSPDRAQPVCPNAGRCGGCQIMHLTYDAQLRFKENKVKELLTRVGGFEPGDLEEAYEGIIGYGYKEPRHMCKTEDSASGPEVYLRNDHGSSGSECPIRYRNKAQYPVGTDREGNIITGFYAVHSHSIIPCTDCLIGASTDAAILKSVREFMKDYRVSAYDESTHTGLIRHVLIRTGFSTGEIQVCLVINGRKLPHADELVSNLLSPEPGRQESPGDGSEPETGEIPSPHIVSICINTNTDNTNVIMGEGITVLYGKDHISDKIGDLKFHISPLSFYQVNPVQTRRLYGKALDYAGLTGSETVWDLYCGIGTISLFLARTAGRVYGIEVVPEAIEDARENACINGIENTGFIVGKAEEILPGFHEKDSAPDVIVVDPPRKGCDAVCLDTMLSVAPDRIVYVSCDPATLARDIRYLCEKGTYSLTRFCCTDMFIHSVHIETVVCLKRTQTALTDISTL